MPSAAAPGGEVGPAGAGEDWGGASRWRPVWRRRAPMPTTAAILPTAIPAIPLTATPTTATPTSVRPGTAINGPASAAPTTGIMGIIRCGDDAAGPPPCPSRSGGLARRRPKALADRIQANGASFDHLVGGGEELGRHVEFEGFGGHDLDDQLV